MASQVDVVIVGAGAAGLSAAKFAVSHGLSFVLVEASDRIGGRAHTEEFVPGQPIDRGCHWMRSASLNPFVGIAETLGFRYRRECGWNSTIHHYGAFLDDGQTRGVDALVEADLRSNCRSRPTRGSRRCGRRQFGQPMGAVPCLLAVAGYVVRCGRDRCRRYRGLPRNG